MVGVGACAAGETAIAAGGTYLTGMHSCLKFFLILFQDENLEMRAIQRYLNMLPTSQDVTNQACSLTDDALVNTGVHWMCTNPETLVLSWCNQFTMFVNKQPSVGRVSQIILIHCQVNTY